MTHAAYQSARNDAIAFLTAMHMKAPEVAADIYEGTNDPGLLVYVLALMTLGILDGVAEMGGYPVPVALGMMGAENARMA